MKMLKMSCALVTVSLVSISAFAQANHVATTHINPLTNVQAYQNEKGVIDFNQMNAPMPLTTGLVNINKALAVYGLQLVVPVSAPEDFNNAIQAQIKTITNGQISDSVTDHFNLSTYKALVITLPSGFDKTMTNKAVYLTGLIPAKDTPANGGLMNVFAYMSGQNSLAPSIAITTQSGLDLIAPNSDVTNINHTTPDVGAQLNATDNQILKTTQSNQKSIGSFYNTINPATAWWDSYYTSSTDPVTQKNVFTKNDYVFSDWKSDTVNWYPSTSLDAYFSISLPYGKNATTRSFQISYIGFGQGYAPNVDATFAASFPNRPLYFARPDELTYHNDGQTNWWSTYLKSKRQMPVLSDKGMLLHDYTVPLDHSWDNPTRVTKDKNGHAVITLPSSPTDLGHIAVNNASTAYELHNNYTYTYQMNIAATQNGQPVTLTADDVDLPSLSYTFTNSEGGKYESVYNNGKISLKFTAHCPADANGQVPMYCSAVFTIYHEMSGSGRTYTLTNPSVTYASNYTLLDEPAFWVNIPKDQWWDGSKVYFADFHNLKKCDPQSATYTQCVMQDKQIEYNFNQGFMSLDKQWGGENGGVIPTNVKLQPSTSDREDNGYLALTENHVPLVKFSNLQTDYRDLNMMQCDMTRDDYTAQDCAEATLFTVWTKQYLSPLLSNKQQTPASKYFGFLANAEMHFMNDDDHINVLDTQAAYDPGSATNATCTTIDSTNDLCRVSVPKDAQPDYCSASGSKPCVFWAPNTSDDHKDMQTLMGQLHIRTGSGIIARHRSASGKYMMCVKMPEHTGASFSSWMFGYEAFLQGDKSWLHENGAKRNSELDFMESSYFNSTHPKTPFQVNESDFGSYGGMISNAGSASYRDYYNVNSSNNQSKYIWMGYDYHTGETIHGNAPYQHSDTDQLHNNDVVNLDGDAQQTLDSVQNKRADDYVDIYVDTTTNCTTDGINASNFDSIWQNHLKTAKHIQGESQTGKPLTHTMLGGSQGLGWLPYRYARWTIALWNPASKTIIDGQAPYIGWAGTPVGDSIDHNGTVNHHQEADISYVAMEPKSDMRDKIEFDTGSAYWSSVYDDSALNINPKPTNHCQGTVFPLGKANSNDNIITQAFDDNGVTVTLPSLSKALNWVKNGDELDVCVPNDHVSDIPKLQVQLTTKAGAKSPTLDCFSNTSSKPVKAVLDMHGSGANAYAECKFQGA